MRQALLYWDCLSSIVPSEDHYDPTGFVKQDACLQELSAEGLYFPYPANLAFGEMRAPDEFSRETIAIVKSKHFKRILDSNRDRWKYEEIYNRKFCGEAFVGMFRKLKKDGLAESGSSGITYKVERATAFLLMAQLAKYLADAPPEVIGHRLRGTTGFITGSEFRVIPSTDFEDFARLIFARTQPFLLTSPMLCLGLSLRNILSIPAKGATVREIIRFRQKRAQELANFRLNVLDPLEASVKKSASLDETRGLIQSFSGKLTRGVGDLRAALSDAQIPTILGTVQTILKPSSSTFWGLAATTLGYASKISDLPLDTMALGTGVMAAVDLIRYAFDKRNERRTTLRNSAYSYIYHAERELRAARI